MNALSQICVAKLEKSLILFCVRQDLNLLKVYWEFNDLKLRALGLVSHLITGRRGGGFKGRRRGWGCGKGGIGEVKRREGMYFRE